MTEFPAPPSTLPRGEALNWYRVERVLGRGGFGAVYLARDTNLDLHVAIKEYLPPGAVRRAGDGRVSPAGGGEEAYGRGLERFIVEARNLVRFRHPNIVRVMSVFRHNGTAYMVMEFEAGESLRERLAVDPATRSREALTATVTRLSEGLVEVHRRGFVHRDIKPTNILVRTDGSPVLIDFGSARATRDHPATQGLTAFVSAGYAPLEQYGEGAHEDDDAAGQGPWSDVYALGGVLYHAVSGSDPVDSMRRASAVFNGGRDPLIPAVLIGEGRYDEPFLRAIDWALRVRTADRPQSLPEWVQALGPAPRPLGAVATSVSGPTPVTTADVPTLLAGATRGGGDSTASPDGTSRHGESEAASRPAAERIDSGPVASRRRLRLVGIAVLSVATGGLVVASWLLAPTSFTRVTGGLIGAVGEEGRGAAVAREDASDDTQGETERSETALQEVQRREAEQAEAERIDAGRARAERAAKAERAEAERAEAERAEAERAEAERAEAERAEAERTEAERAEAERTEAERTEAERAEAERAEAERAEAERAEAERAEAERAEAERVAVAERAAAAEQAEAERVEAEQAAAERAAAELAAEAERLKVEQAAAERAEAERVEEQRAESPQVVRIERTNETDLRAGSDDGEQIVDDAEIQSVAQRFETLRLALEERDARKMDGLTESSEQNRLFRQLFAQFASLELELTDIRVRNAERTIVATLDIRTMVRKNGDRATPSDAYRSRRIVSRRDAGGTWSPIVW